MNERMNEWQKEMSSRQSQGQEMVRDLFCLHSSLVMVLDLFLVSKHQCAASYNVTLTSVNGRLHFNIFGLDARMCERCHETQQFERHRTYCLGIHFRVY